MLDTLLDYIKKIIKSRLLPITLIYCLLFGILVARIFYLQIIKGEEYEEKSVFRAQKTRELKGTRANIYDCNKNLLAFNELSYSVTLEDTGKLTTNTEINEMIHKLIQILEDNGNTLVTTTDFPIKLDKKENLILTVKKGRVLDVLIDNMHQIIEKRGIDIDEDINYSFKFGKKENYSFTVKDSAVLSFKRDAFFVKNVKELTEEQKNRTALEMFEYFRTDVKPTGPRFDIGNEYTNEEALKIMSVRYAMMINQAAKYIPITIASNIDEQTVAAINENRAELSGVEVTKDTHRVYNESIYLSHILGYTGKISSEELEKSINQKDKEETDKSSIYDSNDQVGKSGIENYYEDYLRGGKGEEKVVVDSNNRVVNVADRIEPTTGNDIYLTIDSQLQKACYTILEKKLAGILLSKINNSMDAGTKGESASDIRIPIYDVYYALIKNNIINVSAFESKKASSLEKSVYRKFLEKQSLVIRLLASLLDKQNSKAGNELSEESQEYLDYIYKILVDQNIILTSNIDKTDKKYISFIDEKLSMSEFLQHAISQNWIDFKPLGIGDQYYSKDELYKKLLKYINKLIKNDSGFDKIIYRYLINTYQLTGTEICLLLFEQGVLKNDEETVSKLKNRSMTSYNFLRTKIKRLEITPAQLALEPCSGSIVITDVKTGKIKVMVSYPSYDNNLFANSINPEYYNKIIDNSASPLLNRPTQQSTAPGSTFKMLTSIAALEEGIISTYDTIHDNVLYDKVDPSPKCWSTSSHGTINVINAIQVSCNYFFYEVGYKMSTAASGTLIDHKKGLAKLKKYAELFGFNELSGVELSEKKPNISDTDAIRSAIGQGTNDYTPVQLARYVTTIANKGSCNQLTVVDSIKGQKNNNKKNKKVKKLDVQSSTWNAVWQGMRQVVSNGTIAPLFDKLSVDISGKTGTAQESKSKPNHALFVSFAPSNNPEITVTTVIPNGYTSSNAAELARDVYKYYYEEGSREELLNSEVRVPEMDGQAFSD